MKRSLTSFGLVMASLFTFILLCGVECNNKKDEDDPDGPDLCGDPHFLNKSWEYYNNTLIPADHFVAVEEGKAIYTFSVPTIFNICTHKHLEGYFYIQVKKSYADKVTFAAEIIYRVVFIYYVGPWEYSGVDENYEYEASIDLGMNDVFGEDPGHFFPIINISIPDQGSAAANNAYFENAIYNIRISVRYYDWKDNSGGND
jgi:hypothetical protein